MKIKLFYKKSKQTNQELQEEVNAFMADVDVVDVKYSEGTYGDYEAISSSLSLLVLYNENEEKDMTKMTPLHENLELKPFNFDEFIKDSNDLAGAMTLDVNQKVLPELLDKNMSNWDQLLDMVKEGQLVYREDVEKRLALHEERLDKLEAEMALMKERLRSLEN
ncbi:hypothetical protein [Streptococcus pluranimalium]|uniref:hypothetical protein n=1 Tax=Streptococcus pluranimalium TaxID=82348 RepID=UPI004046D521